MKNRALFVVLLLCLILTGTVFAQTDSIYTEVYSDTAIIWHTNSERNCGSLYDMDVSLDGDLFTITEVDTEDLAYCECIFNFSVTLTGLNPEYYDVDVFSDELRTDDTTYWGCNFFCDWSIGKRHHKTRYTYD